MVVVVAPEDLHDVEHSLERRGETSFVIGSVVERGAGVMPASDGAAPACRASASSSAAAAATCRP